MSKEKKKESSRKNAQKRNGCINKMKKISEL
jgi:hypothetical protein